ncbi:MAG TPA: membrane protein insertion efficiency factor YidD [Blastocatellia bacterium]|nr:membrane protein insertion efficiency factor YidD [Blastocatellia bacterium]
MKVVLIFLIRVYQLILSPILPPSCRFTPTCSEYTMQAIEKYGALRGVYLGARRLLRCHPFNPGGYDPVS